MRRDLHDWNLVQPAHIGIHERLDNWSKWARDRERSGSMTLSMFRYYRPYLYPREPGVKWEIDQLDALKLQKRFATLPEPHRHALGWHYIYPQLHWGSVCRKLGKSKAGLLALVHDSRSMMKNICARD